MSLPLTSRVHFFSFGNSGDHAQGAHFGLWGYSPKAGARDKARKPTGALSLALLFQKIDGIRKRDASGTCALMSERLNILALHFEDFGAKIMSSRLYQENRKLNCSLESSILATLSARLNRRFGPLIVALFAAFLSVNLPSVASAQTADADPLRWVGRSPIDRIDGKLLSDVLKLTYNDIVETPMFAGPHTYKPILRGPNTVAPNGASVPTLYLTYCVGDVTCNADRLGPYGVGGEYGVLPNWAATYIILSKPNPIVYKFAPYLQGNRLSDYRPDKPYFLTAVAWIRRVNENGKTSDVQIQPSYGPFKSFSSSMILDPARGSAYILYWYKYGRDLKEAEQLASSKASAERANASYRRRQEFIDYCRRIGGRYNSSGDSCTTW